MIATIQNSYRFGANVLTVDLDLWYDGTDESFMTLDGSDRVTALLEKVDSLHSLTSQGTAPFFDNRIEFKEGESLQFNTADIMDFAVDWKVYFVFKFREFDGTLWFINRSAANRVGVSYSGGNLIVDKFVASFTSKSLAYTQTKTSALLEITNLSGVLTAKIEGLSMTGSSFTPLTGVIRTVFNSALFASTSGSLDYDFYDFLYKENVTAGEDALILTYLQNKFNPVDIPAPDAITDLAVDTVYFEAISLTFTEPNTDSVIDFYNVHVDGSFFQEINRSGDAIYGLTNGVNYDFTVFSVDILGNTSLVSNTVNQTINGTGNPLTVNFISRYTFEDNVNDVAGSNNGTATSISYVTGGVGKSGAFNGGASKVDIPDANDLSFTDGSDLPFTISLLFNTNATQNSMLVTKRNGTFTEYQCFYSSSGLTFDLMSGGNTSNFKRENVSFAASFGVFYHVVFAYSGSGRQKIYLDGVLQSTTQTLTGTYVGMTNTTAFVRLGKGGFSESSGVFSLNGEEDEVIFWDKELNQSDITFLATEQLAGNDIDP